MEPKRNGVIRRQVVIDLSPRDLRTLTAIARHNDEAPGDVARRAIREWFKTLHAPELRDARQ